MRHTTVLVGALIASGSVAAQEAPPVGFADLEIQRSRDCVGVLRRLEELNQALQPLGERSQRLGELMQAIALEDQAIVETLDRQDATESAVYDWFVADRRLAQSILDTGNQALQQQRTIGRQQVRGTVQAEAEAVQTEAQAIIDASDGLGTDANPCDGAVLIRPVVAEACKTEESPVCAAAADTTAAAAFVFVESPENLWDLQELRPWTQPTGLQVAPNGSLAGARTIAFARQGNVVVTVAFSPLIVERSAMPEAEIAQFDEILDSLGFEFDHPDLAYAPSLALRATLPQPLAGEDTYVLHFGEPDSADVLWTGPAATGELIEAPIVLDPRHVVRLQAGEPIRLTAIESAEGADNEAVFTFELTNVNQSSATRALLGYMAGQMVADLRRLAPPRGV